MSRAIVLTYASVNETEKDILKHTNIFKIAINQHAEEFNPDVRICSDYILKNLLQNFSQKTVSIREIPRIKNERVITPKIEFKGATIISALEYLIMNSYNEILIIGDNKVNHEEFQNLVSTEIDKLKSRAKIYQYTKGNFNLPVKSITEFCSE